MFKLNDAIAAVVNKPEFSIKTRGDYTVIDYNVNSKSTFVGSTDKETNILLNLRGTAFDNETGEIIRLGYHKFFNFGENPSLDETINFDDDHVITCKLDGSCIFPIYARSGTVFGTRAGVTDVSKLADNYLAGLDHKNYQDFVELCMEHNITPIFEFCSRENRIVIDYPQPQLTLTGMRYLTGEYLKYDVIADIADIYTIPVVSRYTPIQNSEFDDFKTCVSGFIDDEGVVIRMESGNLAHHMIKLKASDYVLKHKALDGLRFEKDVLLLELNGLIDDVYPILDIETRTRIQNHTNKFVQSIRDKEVDIHTEFDSVRGIVDRKNFALTIKDSPNKQFLFKMHSGEASIFNMLVEQCKKGCSTQASTKELKEFLGFDLEY